MRVPFAVLVAVAVVLVAVFPLLSGEASPTTTAGGTRPSPLSTDAVGVPAGVATNPLAPTAPVELTLSLADRNPGALSAFLAAVENPASPLYREYLTHSEFETAFAPSQSTVGRVTDLLESAGAEAISVAPDRMSVSARLPAAEVESLLGVRMVQFAGVGGEPLYTALGAVELPSKLAGIVGGVTGLSDSATQRFTLDLGARHLAALPAHAGPNQFVQNNTTGERWYMGSDFTQAFHAASLLPGNLSVANATYPTHVAVATLLASGYNVTNGVDTPPWDPAVVQAYFNDTLAPSWPHSNLTGVPVDISGVTPPMPGSFGNVNDSSLFEVENSLDLEMAGSLAPGAPLYNFYYSGGLLDSPLPDADIASYFDVDLSAALSYNYAPARLGVVSASFGVTDLNDSTWNQELQEAAAMGVTVVAASGDAGNAPDGLTGRSNGPWPIWPASAAFNTSGAVSIGGVSLDVSGTSAGWYNGTNLDDVYDPGLGAISRLSTWWDTLGGSGSYAGSEGGISGLYPEPWFQIHSAAQAAVVNATVQEGLGTLGRAGPDIAFPANATIAYVMADTSGNVYFTVVEGTSIAAPAFAGFLADEIAVAHHSFGYLSPELYRIGSYYAAHPGPADPFYDVLNGSNYVFTAGPGWDSTTGWGAPLATLFLAADAEPAVRNFDYAGPVLSLPPPAAVPPVPWTEIFIIFGVGVTVAIVLVVAMGRPTQRSTHPPPPPFGALAPQPPGALPGGAYGGATFLCPYCGAIRPAEPVRCPRCGAL